jgi:hypothetical protein
MTSKVARRSRPITSRLRGTGSEVSGVTADVFTAMIVRNIARYALA